MTEKTIKLPNGKKETFSGVFLNIYQTVILKEISYTQQVARNSTGEPGPSIYNTRFINGVGVIKDANLRILKEVSGQEWEYEEFPRLYKNEFRVEIFEHAKNEMTSEFLCETEFFSSKSNACLTIYLPKKSFEHLASDLRSFHPYRGTNVNKFNYFCVFEMGFISYTEKNLGNIFKQHHLKSEVYLMYRQDCVVHNIMFRRNFSLYPEKAIDWSLYRRHTTFQFLNYLSRKYLNVDFSEDIGSILIDIFKSKNLYILVFIIIILCAIT